MTRRYLWIAMVTLCIASGCKRDEHTGLPVMDDPSVAKQGISTVPAQVALPKTSEYPKSPPLGALDPETGKQEPLFGGDNEDTAARDAGH